MWLVVEKGMDGIGLWGREIDGMAVVGWAGSVRMVGVVGMVVGGDRTVGGFGMVVVEEGRVVGWVVERVGLFVRAEGVRHRRCRVEGRFSGRGICEVDRVVGEIVSVTHEGWEVEMVDCIEEVMERCLLKDVAHGTFDLC